MKDLGKRAKVFFYLLVLFVGAWIWASASSHVFAQQTGKMYFTDNNYSGEALASVQRANLDGSNIELLIPPEWTNARFIALDVEGGKMYWADTGVIKRANLDGSEEISFIFDLPGPVGIALDLANGKIYWTDVSENNIKRANLSDGTNIEVLVEGLATPHCLALDPSEGKIYWTNMDWSGSSMRSIQRAGLEGTSVETLVTEGVEWPHAIALDLTNKKMYWTDSYRIRKANLDGSNIEDVPLPFIYDYRAIALDIPGNKIYLSAFWPGRILRADLDGNNIEELISADLDAAWGLALSLPPETVIKVAIDIKPGDDPNAINPYSQGVIPVAILTCAAFDATTVDPAKVRFGQTGVEASPAHYAFEDVDGDGDMDLILQFKTQDTGIECGDVVAYLTGETINGQKIEGSDSIKTVGCH